MKKNTHFFTGFPGFLTTHIISELLEKFPNDNVIALVEKRALRAAEDLREAHAWNAQIELVVGDITKVNLGLEKPISFSKTITHFWHLAAIYDLAVPQKLAYAVNVEGTKHVIFFSETLKSLTQFNYISTAYVSGKRGGRIFEDELDEGQEFNNFYESTKFLAEKVVQESTLPWAIFRPAITVGDSQTGETAKFDGPYYLFKLLKDIPNWLPSVNVNTGTGGVNIIPVDFAKRALVALGMDKKSVGEVFHVCDPNPMTPTEIIELSLKFLDKKPPMISVPKSLFKIAAESERIEKVLGIPRQVLDYFNHNANYDCNNELQALRASGISCPHLSTYLSVLIDYYEIHSEVLT